jgi:excisionase family DNA binding protein
VAVVQLQAERIRAACDALADALIAALDTEDGGPPRLLSIDEAGAALGVGRSRIYDEIQAGALRTVLVGRRRLVPAGAVAEFIARRTQEAARRGSVDVPRSP